MLLDPRDPAGQAFVADHLADFPLDSWDDACRESDAYQCDCCQRWFTSRYDFDLDALDQWGERICGDCDGGPCNSETASEHRWEMGSGR